MATRNAHQLFLTLPLKDVRVTTRDAVFLLYRRQGRKNEKLGELRVSQGALVWRGAFDQYGRKIGWRRFSALMEEHGRRAEVRAPGEKKTVPRRKRV
ncbi:MAG: hypothetical protein ACKO0W_03035 [Planctomycetota bacterium]